jgi:transposase
MPRPKKYPDELMDRGVRLALESQRPIAHVAADLGIHPEALRKRVRRAEADDGTRPALLSTEEREEIRKLRREVSDLRRANEILKSASVFFAKERRGKSAALQLRSRTICDPPRAASTHCSIRDGEVVLSAVARLLLADRSSDAGTTRPGGSGASSLGGSEGRRVRSGGCARSGWDPRPGAC